MATEPNASRSAFAVPRRFVRYKLDVPIRVIVDRSDKTVVMEGRGMELNEGGLTVLAGLELHIGSEIDIEFTPPYRSMPIRVRALVRDRSGYFYGVEFIPLTPDEIERVGSIRQILKAMGCPVQ
jgi:hypothetical protein